MSEWSWYPLGRVDDMSREQLIELVDKLLTQRKAQMDQACSREAAEAKVVLGVKRLRNAWSWHR